MLDAAANMRAANTREENDVECDGGAVGKRMRTVGFEGQAAAGIRHPDGVIIVLCPAGVSLKVCSENDAWFAMMERVLSKFCRLSVTFHFHI